MAANMVSGQSRDRLSDDSSLTQTIRGLSSAVDPMYSRKVGILNSEMEKIGYGKYQKLLFLFTGLAYCYNDSFVFAVASSLPSITAEWNPTHPPIATLALNTGILTGSVFWGMASDTFGRRSIFNITNSISSICAVLCGCSISFTTFCLMNAITGFGIGGILTMNAALYLESIPPSKQFSVMLLSVWFSIGTSMSTLIAYPLSKYFSCDNLTDQTHCRWSNNMGWRYLFFTLGGLSTLSFLLRLYFLHILETPKWLLSKGREAQMLTVLQAMAKKNKTTVELTLNTLQEKEGTSIESTAHRISISNDWLQSKFKLIYGLFSSRKLGIFTLLIGLVWSFVGLAYPLFNYFLPMYLRSHKKGPDKSNDTISKEFAIITSVTIPASIISVYLVSTSVGRRGVMSLAACCAGIFLILFTRAYDTVSVIALSCCISFFQTTMYGILYPYTSEVFPSSIRGTGNGVVISLNRLSGLTAPIIASFTDLRSNLPIYLSAGLFFACSVLVALLPFETRGTISL